MESRAKAAGHAVHQQLVVLPLGILALAVAFDVVGLVTGDARLAFAAYLMIAVGVVAGLVASVFGLIDYLAVPRGTRAKRVAFLHGAGNVAVLVLFAGSSLLRTGDPEAVPGTPAFLLGLVALLLAGATGWLGGELVGRLGVGVDDDAGLDAPARLTTGIALPGQAPHPTSRETP
ncbi:DUF2231 domain-containing protein [Promicromonospora thailandica]|uniref:Membrane protein n=1 Tax=Promicromonospora thailandica TaxID=765201 RepID=A0A9X2JWW3_9MICO|nr:DUF2231 domain-containing protein [Promicromonospora thailandica]MCP2267045.1 putative membrane protein [Promicromonospora thailandica]BFF16675.1 hypothetical protein GCM10025730_01960 [Promicromonospora thailandica]